MTNFDDTLAARATIEARFRSEISDEAVVDIREFPDETVFLAKVPASKVDGGAVLANSLDKELQSAGLTGFITVRPLKSESPLAINDLFTPALRSSQATALVNLLTERARTSELQPSLAYVPDTAANISRALTQRHHLVFGRRGAGKTSLLLETKRIATAQGAAAIWLNMQTYRRESSTRILLWIVSRICEAVAVEFKNRSVLPKVANMAIQMATEAEGQLARAASEEAEIIQLIPRMQDLIRRFSDTSSKRLFIFLDDFHYVPRDIQPDVLDLLHACVRDCDAWLKIAAIKHLSKWFIPNPPVGLQTGHDADLIDLDVTLENPARAKAFLEEVLRSYSREVDLIAFNKVFSAGALDRLVVASGAVPRDYMTLCANAIIQARTRHLAKSVGQTDVNIAAGDAAQFKLQELEEDAASGEGTSQAIVGALTVLRRFLIDDKKCTYFRVDYRDKDRQQEAYALLQSLMDGRLVHLINASVSDEHHAGEKSEVYMFDLSQYSGHRVKKFLKMLDFSDGLLILAETGTKAPKRVARTSNDILAILRRGPLFKLDQFPELA